MTVTGGGHCSSRSGGVGHQAWGGQAASGTMRASAYSMDGRHDGEKAALQSMDPAASGGGRDAAGDRGGWLSGNPGQRETTRMWRAHRPS